MADKEKQGHLKDRMMSSEPEKIKIVKPKKDGSKDEDKK